MTKTVGLRWHAALWALVGWALMPMAHAQSVGGEAVRAPALQERILRPVSPQYQGNQGNRLEQPAIDGYPVDHCATWGNDCGQGGADQLCRRNGMGAATGWSLYRPGRSIVLGSNRLCQGGDCTAFRHVQCAGDYASQGVARFQPVQVNGLTVDRCATWGQGCGQAGADQYCQREGFARATRWETIRPGRTWVMGSNRVCDGGDCEGFSVVECERQAATASPGARRFDNPRRQGMAVDHCARWGDGCGQEGADQFCRMEGFTRARSFETRRMGRTWVEGSRRVCDGGNCVGLRTVECVGATNAPWGGNTGSRYFATPTENGIPVDRCATWGNDCGQGGADQFCRRQGFTRATSFETYNPGRTWVSGSSRTCDGSACGALRNVQCQ